MTQQSDYRNASSLDEFEERIHFFPPPLVERFNPLTASPEERARHGIPPQPDPEQQPLLARFWTEMYSPPLVFAPRFLLGLLPKRISTARRVTAAARHEASLNWSGAYITPRDGQQLTEVHATWRIPRVLAPAGMPASAEYRSSIWIGLDGQQRYLDSSLPQFGTGQFVNAPVPPQPFHTWCQWWLRDNPQTYTPAILSLGVAPGQRVMASLHVVNETRVHCIIKNRDTNEFLPFIMNAPTDIVSRKQVKISGATAEWVVERPAEEHTGEPYELPDYNTVPFTNCFALSAKMPAGGVPGPGRERTLDGARLIKMYKRERNPPRTVTISQATPPDVDHFDVFYVT